ncbi:MAG: hypothetical protein LBB82_08395 [Treponema sp.]|jgi:hypothetical protein|nr:hypothetical protein [Treponema sp.]
MNSPIPVPGGRAVLLAAFFFLGAAAAEGQIWYRSNPSGMAVERLSSRMVALHSEWALSVEASTYAALPPALRPYYANGYRVESRLLYQRGRLRRRQWIFRDADGATRINASLPADLSLIRSGGAPVKPAEKKAGAAADVPAGVTAPVAGNTAANTPAVEDAPANTASDDTAGDTAAAGNAPPANTPAVEDTPPAETAAPANTASGEEDAGETPAFVEVFSPDHRLAETHQYLADGIYSTYYNYSGDLLTGAETKTAGKTLWTDRYRYTRTRLLRAVERVYSRAGASFAAAQKSSALPPLSPSLRIPPPMTGFISPAVPFDYTMMQGALAAVYAIEAARTVYNTSPEGRVLSEIRYNANEEIIAEIVNEWSGDRIRAVIWKALGDTGRIVFSYNSAGDRLSEEDYRNGVLERTVRKSGDRDIEEIIVNGRVILRAVWDDGRKISEERL